MGKDLKTLIHIRDNIAKYGYHVYVVSGDTSPSYIYTIGNLDRLGYELISAGGSFYSVSQIKDAIDKIAGKLSRNTRGVDGFYSSNLLTRLELCPVHWTWVQELMLGATDYYAPRQVSALQLVPDGDHRTIDTPDMSRPLSSSGASSWRWHLEPWPYAIPEDSVAVTNLAALRGEPVTEAARWERTQWELFAGAGPDIKEGDVRVVPLSTLLGFDPSLEPVTKLAVGKALWREDRDTPWQLWGTSETAS